MNTNSHAVLLRKREIDSVAFDDLPDMPPRFACLEKPDNDYLNCYTSQLRHHLGASGDLVIGACRGSVLDYSEFFDQFLNASDICVERTLNQMDSESAEVHGCAELALRNDDFDL